MPDLISTVEGLYEAFARGDIPAVLETLADDISWEVEGPAELRAAGIRRSRREVVEFFTALGSDTTDLRLEMTEFLSGDNTVAAFGRYQATARATGIRFDVPLGHFFKFRDGKIVRLVQLSDTGTAANALRGHVAAAGSEG